MLIRYNNDPKGKRVKVAEIYTSEEHKIDKRLIDREALKIIRRLRSSGHQAYLVGGAVRDLLVEKVPKDFDIATDALPRKVKSLFRNSRIIGRRFRLVHVFFGDKIIEVSTFRSHEPGESNNVFGSIEDDVKRRDFSMNALYYDPQEEWVIDYVGGVQDINKKRLKSLIPLDKTFVEDPVRLIRAVKYANNTGCMIPFSMKRSLKKYAPQIADCPSSRLTEELFKILQCGNSVEIIESLEQYGILKYFLPLISKSMADKKIRRDFYQSLQTLDEKVGDDKASRSDMLARLVEPLMHFNEEEQIIQSLFLDTYKEIKNIISPMTPPNHDVEVAVRTLFKEKGLKSPGRTKKRRPPRPRRRRRERSDNAAAETSPANLQS